MDHIRVRNGMINPMRSSIDASRLIMSCRLTVRPKLVYPIRRIVTSHSVSSNLTAIHQHAKIVSSLSPSFIKSLAMAAVRGEIPLR